MPELQGAVSSRVNMKKILLIFSLLLCSCGEYGKSELSIPDEARDKVFRQFINPLTEKYELYKLREKYIAIDDLEIRVWIAASEIDGFILKRITGKWSAIAVKEINCTNFGDYPKNGEYQLGRINLAAPKSGWENAWRKLNEAGILDLPNSDDVSYVDGTSYITEISEKGKYRNYFYSNPNSQKTEEAVRMMKIGEIIADEFGLPNFKIGSLCHEK